MIPIFHLAASTSQVALISSVPLAHILAVGEGIEAGVTYNIWIFHYL